MKVSLFSQPLSRLKADMAVVVVDSKRSLADLKAVSELAGVVKEAERDFKSDRLKRELFYNFSKGSSLRRVLVFYTGHSKAFDIAENLKIFAARSLSYARDHDFSRIAFFLNEEEGSAFVGKVAEGYFLAAYRFDKYKSKKNGAVGKDPSVSLVIRPDDRKVSESQLKQSASVCESVNQCREIVNEPGASVYPETLVGLARDVAKQGKLGLSVWNEKQLLKQGYRGLVEVGKGSVHPPRMIVLRYRPRRRSRFHLALLGKGITFDTGGISIKPSDGMWAMKGDMAGGGAVLYAMETIASLKPAVAVTGIIAAAENFPGDLAQRPGDIFVAKNGKSVMVDNTDAEGRLVLTDALARAGEEKATHVIDIATLTGACVRALGNSVAGVMGSSPELVRAVIQSGRNQGEAFWELPLVEEYRALLKTPYADINNIGGKVAGAITAGLFLREFVPDGVAWAHLDIAGPFILEKRWKYYSEGATGFGLKTMVDLSLRFTDYFAEY